MISSPKRTRRTIALLCGGIALLFLLLGVFDRSNSSLPRARSADSNGRSGTIGDVERTPAPTGTTDSICADSELPAAEVETGERFVSEPPEATRTHLRNEQDSDLDRTPPHAPRWLVKIASDEGGFEGLLREGDSFGSAITEIDDLDGDGIRELAVGAPGDDEAGEDAGAVWILFLDSEEQVRTERKLTQINAGLPERGVPSHSFGHSLCALPDHDGNGTRELAVAQSLVPADDGDLAWQIWCFELDREAAIAGRHSLEFAGFDIQFYGRSRSSMILLAARSGPLAGDWDRLAIAFQVQADGGRHGSMGRIVHVSIGPKGRVSGIMSNEREWGRSVLLADICGDASRVESLCGSVQDGKGSIERLVCVHPPAEDVDDDPQRLSFQKGEDPGDPGFGSSLAWLDDRDMDGTLELAIGLKEHADGQEESPGGTWIVSIDRHDLRVQSWALILPGRDGLPFHASPDDRFGASLATLTDRDGDHRVDLAIGAPGDDAGGTDAGALWLYGPGRGVER